MKPTKEQQEKWIKENRCHVCGENSEHSHPRWMWLANPPPELKGSERVKYEKELNNKDIKNILGG